MSTYAAPAPGNIGAAQTALAARAAFEEALRQINDRRKGILREYGYQGDIDPTTGRLSNVGVDPLNNYGALQETLAQNAQEHTAGQEAMQDRGIRGGLANQQRTRNQHLFGRRKMQLGQGMLGSLSGLDQDQTTAGYARDRALWEAQLAATQNAIGNEEFNPADQSQTPPPGYGEDPEPASTDPTGRSIPAGRPGYGSPAKVMWGGKYRTRDQLIKFLMARGVKPASWAKKHPTDAKRLGIKGGK